MSTDAHISLTMRHFDQEEEIKQRLSGLFLIKIGRTCNMLELTFGDHKSTINEVWHIQSPFRIVFVRKKFSI